MSAYYISRAGGDAELITEPDLQNQVKAGLVAPTDLICRDGWEKWETVEALFGNKAPATTRPTALPPLITTSEIIAPSLPQIEMSIPTRPDALKVKGRVEALMTREESVLAVAAQVLSPMSADGVVLTNRRVFLLEPKFGGLKLSFTDWLWSDVINIHITEGLLGTTLTVQSRIRPTHFVDRLDKNEARALYRIAQQMEEGVRIGRQRIHMAELHAGTAVLRK